LIEHNLDIIFCVYWIIDLGPDGGDKGGEIVVLGTTETVAEHLTSHMGRYLKQVLAQHPPEVVAVVGGGKAEPPVRLVAQQQNAALWKLALSGQACCSAF